MYYIGNKFPFVENDIFVNATTITASPRITCLDYKVDISRNGSDDCLHGGREG